MQEGLYGEAEMGDLIRTILWGLLFWEALFLIGMLIAMPATLVVV